MSIMSQAVTPLTQDESSKTSTNSDANVVDEDEEIIKELCTSNGLKYSALAEQGLKCTTLEMFFSGYPRMIGLEIFPNLQRLCIVGQTISSIEGLGYVPQLRELWVVECAVKNMSGLEKSIHLRQLFLYSNRIRRIEHLTKMSELETLHLSSNSILQIEGLESLTSLKELRLAENHIEKIGNTLSGLKKLEILDLSGNRLNSLWDLTRLGSLPALRDLSLKSSLYAPCPVGGMCNYTTHLLYHLPHLKALDGCDVSADSTRQHIDGLVVKKKTFYNMKLKAVEFDLTEMLRELRELKAQVNKPLIERLRRLIFIHKQLTKEMEDYKTEDGSQSDEGGRGTSKRSPRSFSVHVNKFQQKVSRVTERIAELEQALNRVESWYKDGVSRAERIKHSLTHQLEVELETGGNIAFEQGSKSQPWYNPLIDLVQSRFSEKFYKPLSVSGIQVTRVTKVSHKLLEHRFQELVDLSLEDQEDFSAAETQPFNKRRKMLEFLFWIWNPSLPGGLSTPTRILEDGFLSAEMYRKLGCDAAVPLSNSVAIADRYRIAHCLKQTQNHRNDSTAADHCSFRYGQMILAKAYVGKTVRYKDTQKIERCNFPNVDSVIRLSTDLPEAYTINLLPPSASPVPHSSDRGNSTSTPQTLATNNVNVNSSKRPVSGKPAVRAGEKGGGKSGPERSKGDPLGKGVGGNSGKNSRESSEISAVSVGNSKSSQNGVSRDVEANLVNGARVVNGVAKVTASKDSSGTLTRGSEKGSRLEGRVSKTSDSSCSNCADNQCEWFVFDHRHVLPAYIIDFKYITETKPSSPFHDLLDNRLCGSEADYRVSETVGLVTQSKVPADDNDVINMLPQQNPVSRIQTLTQDMILRLGRMPTISSITSLSLNGCGLTHLPSLYSLISLERLVLSFNQLQRLEGIANQRLAYLDVSFNILSNLQGLKNLTELEHLDASWNVLEKPAEEILLLAEEAPSLVYLDLRHNAWLREVNLSVLALAHLKLLTTFNGVIISEEERKEAIRLVGAGHVTQPMLLRHARLDTEAPRSLTLLSVAQAVEQVSDMRMSKFVSSSDLLWPAKVTGLCLDSQCLTSLQGLERLSNLRWASFCHNELSSICGLEHCVKLEELSVTHNCIQRLDSLERFSNLRRLSIGHNCIRTLEGAGLNKLHLLSYLSIECNRLIDMCGLTVSVDLAAQTQAKPSALAELYAGFNSISNLHSIFLLKSISTLELLDLSGNPIWREAENYRSFLVYHLTQLKALDGLNISQAEVKSAIEMYGGRLTQDFVAERLNQEIFADVKELSFPHCDILSVNLGDGNQFENLLCVNLEGNNLTSFSGLVQLPNLKVLCLNHNRVESVFPRRKSPVMKNKFGKISYNPVPTASMVTSGAGNKFLADVITTVLPKLETLHLGYNSIKDLVGLQLDKIPSLKALFLQGNEISKVEGIGTLSNLTELVLDGNRIKHFADTSFLTQQRLRELHVEENRLRSFSHINPLVSLTHLYAGKNKIEALTDLHSLESLGRLKEVWLLNNPVTRRQLHRPHIIHNVATVVVIDGQKVTEDERMKVDIYYMDQEETMGSLLSGVTATSIDTSPPTATTSVAPRGPVPIRVTNIQLLAPSLPDSSSTATTTNQKQGVWSHTVFPSLDVNVLETGKGASGGRRQQIVGPRQPVGSGPEAGSTGGSSRSQRGRLYINKRQHSSAPKQSTTNHNTQPAVNQTGSHAGRKTQYGGNERMS